MYDITIKKYDIFIANYYFSWYSQQFGILKCGVRTYHKKQKTYEM